MSKKYKSEIDYFQSEEFKKGYMDLVKQDTWEKGFPMVYMNDEGQIVKHWKDGKIEVIHEAKK